MNFVFVFLFFLKVKQGRYQIQHTGKQLSAVPLIYRFQGRKYLKSLENVQVFIYSNATNKWRILLSLGCAYIYRYFQSQIRKDHLLIMSINESIRLIFSWWWHSYGWFSGYRYWKGLWWEFYTMLFIDSRSFFFFFVNYWVQIGLFNKFWELCDDRTVKFVSTHSPPTQKKDIRLWQLEIIDWPLRALLNQSFINQTSGPISGPKSKTHLSPNLKPPETAADRELGSEQNRTENKNRTSFYYEASNKLPWIVSRNILSCNKIQVKHRIKTMYSEWQLTAHLKIWQKSLCAPHLIINSVFGGMPMLNIPCQLYASVLLVLTW